MATIVSIVSNAGKFSGPLRGRGWRFWWLLISLPALAQPQASVSDLRYGVVLYEYYQDNYFTALTELMVAEARGGIKGQSENPQVITGGLSLAYGLERKADDLFNQLLDSDAPTEVRNAAWYYLAQLRYLHHDWAGSAASLARVAGNSDPALATRLQSLQINLALRSQQLDAAADLLADYPGTDPQWSYHTYNLGAAYSRQQLHSKAQVYYRALVQHTRHHFDPDPLAELDVEQQQAEALALYDKALAAEGYSLLQAGRHAAAIARFSEVRKDGDLTYEALLGYGWAALQQQNYSRALAPWQLLSEGPISHGSVQEGVLAVAYVFEQLGAEAQALQAYELAEQRLAAETLRLQALALEINAASIGQLLSAEKPGVNWLAPASRELKAPRELKAAQALEALQDSPASLATFTSAPGQTELDPLLTILFAQNRFQGALQAVEDSLVLQQNLRNWQARLEVLQWSWQARYAARTDSQARVAARPWRAQGNALQEQRDELQQRLANAREQRDYLALASADTAANWRRVQRMQANVERLQAAGKSVVEYLPALRMLQGIVLWQAAENFPAALWQNEKNLRAANAALASLAADQQRVELALQSAADITPFAARIGKLQRRVAEQMRQADSTLANAEQQLTQQLLTYLGQQQQRLRHYLAQARLAKARLYDKALDGTPQ